LVISIQNMSKNIGVVNISSQIKTSTPDQMSVLAPRDNDLTKRKTEIGSITRDLNNKTEYLEELNECRMNI
jgi:hypothetical protein